MPNTHVEWAHNSLGEVNLPWDILTWSPNAMHHTTTICKALPYLHVLITCMNRLNSFIQQACVVSWPRRPQVPRASSPSAVTWLTAWEPPATHQELLHHWHKKGWWPWYYRLMLHNDFSPLLHQVLNPKLCWKAKILERTLALLINSEKRYWTSLPYTSHHIVPEHRPLSPRQHYW